MIDSSAVGTTSAFVCSAIAFVCGYIVLVRGRKSSDMKIKERAQDTGSIVVGVVCGRKRRGESTEARNNKGKPAMQELIVVDYRYYVEGREYHKSLSFQEAGFGSIRYPEQIDIYYDPRDPSRCVTSVENPEVSKKLYGWYGTIFLSILVFVVVMRLLEGE